MLRESVAVPAGCGKTGTRTDPRNQLRHAAAAPKQLSQSSRKPRFSTAGYVTKVTCKAAIKVNAHALIDCLDAKPKVTPSCDCGALFTCPIVEGIQASESLP